jgi:sugar lactone lactonase YvrE
MRLHYLKFLSVLFIVLTFSSTITSQVVSTYAGSGNYGYLDSVASIAKFFNPWAVCSDVLGNVYVGDGNNVVRKISPSGQVTTFAGTGATGSLDGQGNTATFYYPRGLCSDSMGNIYVSDQWNHKIRKISPAGIVSTFAGNGTMGNSDGQGQSASFQYPAGLCIDKQGNIYVADNANQRIRKITPSGFVSTLAGSSVGYVNGTGSAARFYSPQNLCADSVGNIYVTDSGNDVIRKISPLGVVTTFAGSGVLGNIDGLGSTAAFDVAWGIA